MAFFSPAVLYQLYERRLVRALDAASTPRHIGVILDGNRRWAKSMGAGPAQGHRKGAGKISEFLCWAEEVGCEVVTLWMLSTDNLKRSDRELDDLMAIICDAVDKLATARRWRLRIVGDRSLLPEGVRRRLDAAEAASADVDGLHVNVAVGYGGREEIVDAVREILHEGERAGSSLADVAAHLSVADITAHLYTKGQPDPDLVIRTSGEQRLSGFLLWQSAHSEFYFCEAYWPDFRRVDFLRALRDYSQRERRMGR
ncbi:isoprenyl transferase [Nanchangia anserum]|uniref:Isoprenyl transferase n=1 Tax=Nanchangia anserum TaxID=2692125 RepID=A0A8I0GFN2_9ACTO|nr:isoprenyl transferase [Nanchangia anserum]MBD3689967.1 isoprenyl transferase [Nanchangia anserum]QOX82227.1 isoprenyl transferase [Nanchangia anserum]